MPLLKNIESIFEKIKFITMRIYTRKQVAKILKKTVPCVVIYIKKGLLKEDKDYRGYFITEKSLVEYLIEKTNETQSILKELEYVSRTKK